MVSEGTYMSKHSDKPVNPSADPSRAHGSALNEFVRRYNNATKEEIAQAMEKLPTDALEWAVKFEALAHEEKS